MSKIQPVTHRQPLLLRWPRGRLSPCLTRHSRSKPGFLSYNTIAIAVEASQQRRSLRIFGTSLASFAA